MSSGRVVCNKCGREASQENANKIVAGVEQDMRLSQGMGGFDGITSAETIRLAGRLKRAIAGGWFHLNDNSTLCDDATAIYQEKP